MKNYIKNIGLNCIKYIPGFFVLFYLRFLRQGLTVILAGLEQNPVSTSKWPPTDSHPMLLQGQD